MTITSSSYVTDICKNIMLISQDAESSDEKISALALEKLKYISELTANLVHGKPESTQVLQQKLQFALNLIEEKNQEIRIYLLQLRACRNM